MKKIIGVIILAIVTGVSFSIFIFDQYEEMEVSKEVNKIYFIEQGVYSSYSNMTKNTKSLEAYTYLKENNKYYVYVCFTTKEENLKMIQEYFKSLNYSTHIIEKELNNFEFLNILKEYDYLMSAINKEETVKNICKQLVKKYEEYK